jgi:phosphoglucosamine mutase
MKRLFGTDGIRGVAGEPPLDPPTVRRFGAALAEVLAEGKDRPPRVVIGRDTRESGVWLTRAVADGLAARGSAAVDAGVITTPGLAYSTRTGGFGAGVMISASHNPFRDNGLKVFSRDGVKLPDDSEAGIEASILDGSHATPPEGRAAPVEDSSLSVHYVAMLEGAVAPGRFRGLRLVLDCANGAATAIAPAVFRHLGAEVMVIGDTPDGRNINLACGSLHLDGLAERVRDGRFDLGLAFDGDADRCLAVDRRGRVVDGDHILFLAGRALKRRGVLQGDAVVATIMSNFWLEKRLGDEGIRLHRAAVGDKYVLERMVLEDAILGGEQSGHVIFRDRSTTGDGVLTGILLVDMLRDEAEPLDAILDGIVPFPQVLLNVRVREKPDFGSHAAIGPELAAVEKTLSGRGRVVLRYSGTEPLARVMVEADDGSLVEALAARLAGVIKSEIGD